MNTFLLRLREDFPTLILLAALLVLTSTSVVLAEWTASVRGLTTVALLALLAGYLLARSAFSELTALTASTIYGAFVVGSQQALTLSPDLALRERAVVYVERMLTWLANAVTGGVNPDNLVFSTLVAILFWFISYNAAWSMFRGQRLWRAVVPTGVALLVNLSYYAGEVRLNPFLLAFLFAMLLLAVRTNTVARENLWRNMQMTIRPGSGFGLLRAGILASAGLLALAWLAPVASADDRLVSVWEEEVAPRVDLAETWDRLFEPEGGQRNAVADYYGGQTLTLGGSINLSNRPVMDVRAPAGPRYYWRSKAFDVFDGRTWITTRDARLHSEFGVLYYEDAGYQLRRNVRQRFDLRMPATRLLYSASQPSSVSLPVTFDVLFIDRSQERGTLHALQVDGLLRDGDSYEAISSVSYADENSLRAAGTTYPGWVQRAYLGVPESTSQRTRDLATELAAPYDNPFDKAQAIEGFLRQHIVYNESISAPPPDVDAVDWVLFEQPEGYCNYYATAMVVMLRSQAIPARIATGFAQGAYDQPSESFRVVESDAHSWVEAYFPAYGWIEFEPTAAQPAITARGDSSSDEFLGGSVPTDPPIEEPLPEQQVAQPAPEEGGPETGSLSGIPPAAGLPLAALCGLVVLAASVLAGGVLGWREAGRRGLRGLSGTARAYAMLNVAASWLGLELPTSRTPIERAQVLGAEMPEAAAPIHEIASLYVRERYATDAVQSVSKEAAARAGDAWQVVRPSIFRRLLWRLVRRR